MSTGIALALCGYSQAGKDTAAQVLVQAHGFTRVAIADRMKDLLAEANPTFLAHSMGGGSSVEVELRDAVLWHGWDVCKTSVFVSTGRGVVAVPLIGGGIEIPAESQVRKILQNKNEHLPTPFCGTAQLQWLLDNAKGNVVVTDIRSPDEAVLIKDRPSSWLAEVVRPGYGEAHNAPLIGQNLASYYRDHVLLNDGDIPHLHRIAECWYLGAITEERELI